MGLRGGWAWAEREPSGKKARALLSVRSLEAAGADSCKRVGCRVRKRALGWEPPFSPGVLSLP